MKIVFAASEAAPFAKTGGLAEVAGSLPTAISMLGHEVYVIMPYYPQVRQHASRCRHATDLLIPIGTWKEHGEVLETRLSRNVTVFFIKKDIYFDRPDLYGTARGDYPDNAERFIFFSRAVLELCIALDLRPDIIHCNDWQTGLVPLYLRTRYGNEESLRRSKSIFTLHNLGYQGLFWHWDMKLTGLDWDVFTPKGLEFWGKINFLKAGLVYADLITTVSRTYSREIQTPEYGNGLDGLLKQRSKSLHGILTGIDVTAWDPAHDPSLPKNYSATKLAGKSICKRKLASSLNFPDSNIPRIGMVTRLVDQKGLDILTEAIPEIMALDIQLVILGTGDEHYHRVLTAAASLHTDRMRIVLRYDDQMAKLVYAGCDLFLMPSRYEPCGLGQMHALRFGTVPIVRRTGGLVDTVTAFNAKTGSGTGFLFTDYSASALVSCLQRALQVYRRKSAWHQLQINGMQQDFSWERSAREYVKVYRKAARL
jgi:starch synthase